MIAGLNVVAADTTRDAQEQRRAVRRCARSGCSHGHRGVSANDLDFSDEDADQLLAAGLAEHVDEMLTVAAVEEAGAGPAAANASTSSVPGPAPTS